MNEIIIAERPNILGTIKEILLFFQNKKSVNNC